MKFTKMHGLGNDYVFVDLSHERIGEPQALARAVSNRHKGIGADGLILICPSQTADLRMEMYNADGSRAQMCGNGLRCVAKYALDHNLTPGPEVRVDTDAGVKTCLCQRTDGTVHSVRVDMGPPSLAPSAIPTTLTGERIVDQAIEIGGTVLRLTCVSMGNPHAVLFVDDLATAPTERLGPLIENAPQFPDRINVHFAQVDSMHHVTVGHWERGSGTTLACGTGACAVCVAGAVTGKSDRTITAKLPGGELQVDWASDNHVYMTGPAVEVFSGHWRPQ